MHFFYNHNPPPGYLDDHGCVKFYNDMAVEFNRQLKERVVKLRQELPEAAITYVDVYAAKFALIGSYKSEGKFCTQYTMASSVCWWSTQRKFYAISCALNDLAKHTLLWEFA